MMTLAQVAWKLGELAREGAVRYDAHDMAVMCSQMADAVTAHLSQPQPVAQGEALAWQYRCITEEGPSKVWHMIDKETYDRWRETSWSRMEFRELFATPTIPTGYRVVPVEPTPEMLERAREVHAPLDGEDDDFDYEFTRTWKAMIAASPSAGGV